MTSLLPHEELPDLSFEEAVKLLRVHSARCDDDDPRMQTGLMFSLHSWNDRLNPANFHEVMACIKKIGPTWSSPTLLKDPMCDLWCIYYGGLTNVTDPNRIRHRQAYILTPDQYGEEESWLDCIGWAVMSFLEVDDVHLAFAPYNDYVKEQRKKHSTSKHVDASQGEATEG